jgi:hypothetical protein
MVAEFERPRKKNYRRKFGGCAARTNPTHELTRCCSTKPNSSRVGRHQGCQMVFFSKIPIWVNFGGPLIVNCWNILWPFGIIYGRLVQFVVICYIFPNLVCLDQENLATLTTAIKIQHYICAIFPQTLKSK